jgi:hypothetical protein
MPLPLYDPLDPMAAFRQPVAGQQPQQPGQQAGLPPDPTKIPMTPQDQDSLLQTVGSKALGGMGYVGGLLDKYTGGRAVRGLLGGQPGELASLIPGSDWMGLTDEQNAVSGKKLLENAGVLDPGDDSWGGMLGGAAVEMALNPTTYMSLGGGALTDAGQLAAKIGAKAGSFSEGLTGLSALAPTAAKAAGRLGIDAADVLNQPLHGLASIHLPFTSPSSGIMLGAGQGGADLLSGIGSGLRAASVASGASKVLDPLNQYLVQPAARYAGALFQNKYAGSTSEIGQAVSPAMVAAKAADMDALRGAQIPLIREAQAGNILGAGHELRSAMEGTADPNFLKQPLSGSQAQAVQDLAPKVNDMLEAPKAKLAYEGAPTPMLQETDPITGQDIAHATRHQSYPDRSSGIGLGGDRPVLAQTELAALGPRQDVLTNFPGGTAGINETSVNPDISGVQGRLPPDQVPSLPQRAATFRSVHGGFTPQMEQDAVSLLPRQTALNARAAEAQAAQSLAQLPLSKQAQGLTMTAGDHALIQDAAAKALTPIEQQQLQLLGRFNKSFDIADYMGKLDPARADKGIPLFANNPIDDTFKTGQAMVTKGNALGAIKDMIAQSAVPYDQAGPGAQRISSDMLGQLGHTDLDTATQRLVERMTANGKITPTNGKAITDFAVPADVYKDMSRFSQGHMDPGIMEPLLKAVDWVTNLTKSWQTSPWPGFNVRNFTSGQFFNWVKDAGDHNYGPLDPRRIIKPIQAAQATIRGETIEGASQLPYFKNLGMSDEEASKAFADAVYQHRALAPGGTSLGSDVMGAEAFGQKLAGLIPGVDPFPGYGATIKSGIPKTLGEGNPFAVAGVGPYNTDANTIMKASREISGSIDDTNRISAMWGKMSQGYSPGAAASEARGMHVDYEALTPFERQVMRRVLPFYSYHRGVVPAVLQELAEQPGGAAGQLAMQAHNQRAANPDQFVPEYLGGGLALPIGKEDQGTQRFLTSLETPIEAALDPIGKNVQETAMGILGQSNPLIKGPIEYATGKQLFTGRDLADLYPRTGSAVADQILMNSPASRALTTFGQITDPRKDLLTKAIDLGTGVKLTDVDMDRQRDLAAREMISDSLRGQEGVGRFESFYARPGTDKSQLQPEDVAMLRLQQALDRKAKERAKTQRIGVQQ